jgi:hypothetical protein
LLQDRTNQIAELSTQHKLAEKAKSIVCKIESKRLTPKAEAAVVSDLVDVGCERVALDSE